MELEIIDENDKNEGLDLYGAPTFIRVSLSFYHKGIGEYDNQSIELSKKQVAQMRNFLDEWLNK